MSPLLQRQVYNKNLINLLSRLIEDYPDMRFTQLLGNFGFISFDKNIEEIRALESRDLIKRVEAEIERLTKGQS